jgi:pyruvate kinase
MVARGDLGLEVDMEELPQLQRRMAYLCAIHGKRLIVATHLLESMIEFPVPTRAEVTDVANAVYEQADAVMLSGETASGKFPVEAVETLDRIVRRTERYPGVDYASKMNLSSARMHLAAAAAQMASELQFKGFVAITQFGRGAEYISNMRPRGLPIYAFTNSERTYRTLLFCRSVYPFLVEDFSINPEFTLEQALRTLRDREGYQRGEQFMVLANILTAEGFVNSLQVRKIP